MTKLRKTKIIATLGPASNTPSMIKALVEAGANVFRLNFSHGDHKVHRATCDAIRQVQADLGHPVAVIADLQGPKHRIGAVPGGGAFSFAAGDILSFSPQPNAGTIPLPHPEIFASVQPGHRLLLDDGRIHLCITSTAPDCIKAKALNDGNLTDRKGVSLPDTKLRSAVLTDKDITDLDFALGLGVDWIALSFVQTAQDVTDARARIGTAAGIIAKIEKPLAVENFDAIAQASDAVMIARGDLGVEADWSALPALQAELAQRARRLGVPVIVATQMLESMTSAPLPTRAEATDVFNAVSQGVDAVMLSAETATGDYPAQAIAAMHQVAIKGEDSLFSAPQWVPSAADTDLAALAGSAAALARQRGADCIVALTETGETARQLACQRGCATILALCPTEVVSNRLCLIWGVYARVHHAKGNEDAFPSVIRQRADIPVEFAPEGTPVVITSGPKAGVAGGTNALALLR